MDVASMVYRREGDGWFFNNHNVTITLPHFSGGQAFLYPVLDKSKLVNNT